MPFTRERADKTSHAEFIENSDITSLVDESVYITEPSIESAQKLANGFSEAPHSDELIPSYVYASDGSFYEASLDERYPSTKAGYVKISSLILDVAKYLNLTNVSNQGGRRYIDPILKSELDKNVKALSMALPSSNLRYKHANNVADGFRMRLYEDFCHEKTRLPNSGRFIETLFRLSSSVGNHGMRVDHENIIFIYKCPCCAFAPDDNGYGKKGFAIPESDKTVTCSKCSMTIYPTDNLRLHETITDHGGLSGGLSRIMNVSEYLLLAHTIIDCIKGDYKSTLSNLCFFIDGPLALFGQPAWLHRPIMELIYNANKQLNNMGLPPFLMIGIQKQGTLADHARMIAKHLPRNHFRFVDDEYRSRHISPVPKDNNFGNETYFGQDIIYHTQKGNTFVLGTPYPFADKSHTKFKTEKVQISNYPNLDKLFAMVNIFESDLYQGSLVPIIIAHRNASISRMPGGKILDIAAKIGFDKKS